MGGLLSFLGGTAFRWLFGALIDQWNSYQEHKHEVAMLELQHKIDADKNQWQREAIKLQAEMGVKVIEAQTAAASSAAADAAFNLAIQGVNEASRREDWVGKFNAFIRPELAQVSILLLAGSAIWPQHITLTPLVTEVICGVLGVFVGDRINKKQ